MANKDVLGRWGEELAVEYLTNRGYLILERNWRCRDGEIDIVARHGGELVFVEVKTRASVQFGHPFEAITAQKLARLHRLAASWCQSHPRGSQPIRIDALAIVAPRGHTPTVEHLEGLF